MNRAEKLGLFIILGNLLAILLTVPYDLFPVWGAVLCLAMFLFGAVLFIFGDNVEGKYKK